MEITINVSEKDYKEALDHAVEYWDPRGWELEDFLTEEHFKTNIYDVISTKMRKDVPELKTRTKLED